MKKVIGIFVVLAIIAAGAAYGLIVYPQKKATQEVEKFLADMKDVAEKPTHEGVDYSIFNKKVTIKGLKIKPKGEGDPLISIQNTEWVEPNLEMMGKIDAEEPGPNDNEMQTVVKSALMTGMTIKSKEGDLTIDKATVSDIKMSPAAIRLSRKSGEELTPQEAAQVVLNFAAGKIEIEKLSATSGDEKKSGVVIDHIGYSGINQGQFGDLVIKGMKTDDKDGKLDCQEFVIKGLDIKKLLEELAKGTDPESLDFSTISLGDVQMKGINVSAEKAENIQFKEISLTNLQQKDQVPTSFTFLIAGLNFKITDIKDPMVQATFQGLGYESIDMTFKIDYAWNPDNKNLELKKSLNIVDAGEITLALAVNNIDLASLKENPNPQMLLPALLFKRAELRYVDASLAPKLLKFFGDQQGMGEEDVKAMLVAQLNQFKEMFQGSQAAPAAIDSLIAFVNKPDALTITVEPPEPVPFMALAEQAQTAPPQLVDALNLKVATGK